MNATNSNPIPDKHTPKPQRRGWDKTPTSNYIFEYYLRKRAPKGRPWLYFTENAQMVCDHPALLRSSDPGLNAYYPTLFLLISNTAEKLSAPVR